MAKRFLDRIRRIEALNEDTAYRAISSEASDIDAVRVMTIHGSKGLEFSGVHLPVIAAGYMPSTRGGARIEPPPSLMRLVMQAEDRDAEEECLFFVAMSRARDVLSLSYAQKYTEKRNSNPSKFLGSLNGLVTYGTFAGSGKAYVSERALTPPEGKEAYTERELEIYTQCPARYRDEYIDGLHGGRDEVRIHSLSSLRLKNHRLAGGRARERECKDSRRGRGAAFEGLGGRRPGWPRLREISPQECGWHGFSDGRDHRVRDGGV